MKQNESEGHVHPSDKEEINPQLGSEFIPKAVFLIKTKHNTGAAQRSLLEKAKKDMPYIPPAQIEQILSGIMAKMSSHAVEWHALVLAQGAEEWHMFAAHAHNHEEGDALHIKHRIEVGHCDVEEIVRANFRMNALDMQHDPEWKGERAFTTTIEGTGWEDIKEGLEREGVLPLFMELYPRAGEEVMAKDEPVVVDAAKRKALVKRFGKKAIADLEARIKSKQQQSYL